MTIKIPPDFSNIVPINLIEGKIQRVNVYQEARNHDIKAGAGAGVSFNAEGSVKAGYMDMLKLRIFKTWQYPEDAINKGRQGNVDISFVLDGKGQVIDIGVVNTSGTQSLDSAAISAVKQSAPFGPFAEDAGRNTLKVTGHFCYVLD